MITPYLEKLIHEGRAVWKQEVFGIAQAFSFKLPEKSYIIITDFTYSNFIEIGKDLISETEPFIEWQTILRRSIHQTKFSSIVGDYNYVMRDNINHANDLKTAGDVWWSNDIQQFNCYQIHTEYLQIQFCVALHNLTGFPIQNNLRNDNTKFSAPPQGVGTVNNGGFVNLDGLYDGNIPEQDYVFDDFRPLSNPFGAGYMRDRRLKFPINTVTQFVLYIGNYASLMRCCPIINMSYVLVNEELPKNLKTR